ncbi:MAG TPA: hypothetical protein PKC58_15855 [Ignavibacteria bacterium]|nr:hypothetical protein [Ignavibacteria bacterium]
MKFESVFDKAAGDIPKKEVGKCRWSYRSLLPGEEMLPFVRDVVFKLIRSLGSEMSSFTQYMQNDIFIILKTLLLKETIKRITICGRCGVFFIQ